MSEGIAETGLEILLDDELEQELGRRARRVTGLDADLERAHARSTAARRPLRGIGLDAALMIHEHGASTDDAQAHVERWGLATPEQAAHTVRFVTDPTWRAYVVTYSAGAAALPRVRRRPTRPACGRCSPSRCVSPTCSRREARPPRQTSARGEPSQASAMLATWRWSVPQQPPSTVRCGSRSRIST